MLGMLQEIPSSLRLLLETQVEEELYDDWASLLESILVTYCPPRSHLILCFTVLVHPTFREDHQLQKSAYRILHRTSALYGPRAFKNVIEFEPARQKRRKNRHSITESTPADADIELSIVTMANTDSLFTKFSDIWELLGYSFTTSGSGANRWQQVVDLLLTNIRRDWDTACRSNLDLTKTMIIQLLRDLDDKRTDLRKIIKQLFAGLANTAERRSDPFTETNGSVSMIETSSPAATDLTWAVGTIVAILRMMVDIAKTPRLNVLLENEVISTLADTVAPLPIDVLFELIRPLNHDLGTDMQRFILSICNSLLFRLAVYPDSRSKGGERIVDQKKLQGWCAAKANSTYPAEIIKVEYLKYVILVQFFMLKSSGLEQDEASKLSKQLAAGFETVAHTIEHGDRRRSSGNLDTTNDSSEAPAQLVSVLLRCKRAVEILV